MAETSLLDQISIDDVLAKVRIDKEIALYAESTPENQNPDLVRIFRASRMHNLCAVESAFALKLMRDGKNDKLLEWQRSQSLPGKLQQIVDTGTVIHTQLQYYAGLLGKVREGQWRCPNCGFFTHKKVPMPTLEVFDKITDLEYEYPAPCPKCTGRNLAMFPPWRYVEPSLIEVAKGVPERELVSGHCDGIWHIRLRIGKKMVWIPVVVDFKTINKFGFEDKYDTKLPKVEHIGQMQTYLNLAEIDVGILIYYCKDDSKHKYKFIPRSHGHWGSLMHRVNWARKPNMKEKKKFRYCPSIGHPRARSCFFSEQCWGKKTPENFL
jgi:hypothetical protein